MAGSGAGRSAGTVAGNVLGVDGCPGGWVGALVGPGRQVSWRFWSIEQTADVLAAAPVVAIDMPIGLPETGRRSCDEEARARLGSARHSVFPVPSRPVLDAEDYAGACKLARARGELAPSKQLWGLRPRIRALDMLVTPAMQSRVIECHPELAFLELLGTQPASKRTAVGVGQRLHGLDVTGAVLAGAPAQARPDDALDALICAWTAARWSDGRAVLLGDGRLDQHGLRMQIVA